MKVFISFVYISWIHCFLHYWKFSQEAAVSVHQNHFLCLLSRLLYVESHVNDEVCARLFDKAPKILQTHGKSIDHSFSKLRDLVSWFSRTFKVDPWPVRESLNEEFSKVLPSVKCQLDEVRMKSLWTYGFFYINETRIKNNNWNWNISIIQRISWMVQRYLFCYLNDWTFAREWWI